MGHQAQPQRAAYPVHPHQQRLWLWWKTRKWLISTLILAVTLYHYLVATGGPSLASKASRRVNVEAVKTGARINTEQEPPLARLEDDDHPAQGYQAYPLTLKTPRYNLLPLRSVLQHSNTSWQTTPKEARGYFVQSLIWMQMIDGLRPVNPGKYMSAACSFGADDEMEASIVNGRIHPFDLHPGDRSTGHGFVFYVDCQLPDNLQETPHDLPEITLAFVMDMGKFHVPTLPDFEQPLRMRVGNTDVPIEITPPMKEKSEFAVCLSPLTFTWQDIPIWQLIEWRMHYAKLGVERCVSCCHE